ncbi:MAG TPA: hypothetical protein VFZ93_06500, partial [Albitalea sp.]
MPRYLQALDPRRSLSTAVAWLTVALSLAIALALMAVGDYAVNSMLAQRDGLMMRYATHLAAEFDRLLAGELAALESLRGKLPLDRGAAVRGALDGVLTERRGALKSVALLDTRGRLLAQRPNVSLPPPAEWLRDDRCFRRPGMVGPPEGQASRVLMLCAPLTDAEERPVLAAIGVVSEGHFAAIVEGVRLRIRPDARARVLLLDERHQVHFERPALPPSADVPMTLPGVLLQASEDGERMVVVRAPGEPVPTLRMLGLHV